MNELVLIGKFMGYTKILIDGAANKYACIIKLKIEKEERTDTFTIIVWEELLKALEGKTGTLMAVKAHLETTDNDNINIKADRVSIVTKGGD